ncbi:MAG TPA: DUF3592 domain-containing protein, partial [Solirubrobacteraceae bacterium]|jgi:hypothetical protein|nr:DUF3592 domain-containing protein [Solirubrobacteraceae bacterium]
MFGRDKKAPAGEAARAVAVVVRSTTRRDGSGEPTAHWGTFRVRFEDGVTAERAFKTAYREWLTKDLGNDRGLFRVVGEMLAVGATVPVRYDPADRAKFALDRAAFEAEVLARRPGEPA